MVLTALSTLNFKNLSDDEIQFSPSLNCFVGANGAGKTNVLDAVYYLSLTKSAFGLSDMQCVRHDQDFFIIKGTYNIAGDKIDTITCSYKRSAGKKVKRGAKDYDRMSEHIGLFPAILVCPQDVALIAESGDERRRFLNAFLSQTNPEYLLQIMRYNEVLAQRNRALKTQGSFGDMIDIFSEQLSQTGSIIYKHRAEFVARLAPLVAAYYKAISGDSEQVLVEYVSKLAGKPLADLLAENLQRDMAIGHTTVGIHRDELQLSIGGYPIRRYGSQGQQKSLLVALRLAQAKIVAQHCGRNAIMLLDDVFDKLDMARVENLIELVAGENFGQIFITDSNKVRLQGIVERFAADFKLFEVKDGVVDSVVKNSVNE